LSATSALVSVEQFLALPEVEGVRREPIEGEVITMAWAVQPHEIVKSHFLQQTRPLLQAESDRAGYES